MEIDVDMQGSRFESLTDAQGVVTQRVNTSGLNLRDQMT